MMQKIQLTQGKVAIVGAKDSTRQRDIMAREACQFGKVSAKKAKRFAELALG